MAVASERHFARAAEACYVSQPALSASIAKLERELNVTLRNVVFLGFGIAEIEGPDKVPVILRGHGQRLIPNSAS